MQLRIGPTRLISEVQQEFNAMFPFLKMEFYQHKYSRQQQNTISQLVPHDRKIGECQDAVADGVIKINETMKVKELEKLFKDQFRLTVQIFRRSGNVWLQTIMTDDWTLQNQNAHGMEISLPNKAPFTGEAFNINKEKD